MAVLITLIKRNKVSIWDIPVPLITDRFLQYVEIAEDEPEDSRGLHRDGLPRLLFIKSKMLLPSNGATDEEDPREELVERIIEYERVRNMAVAIDDLPMLERDVYCIGRGSLEKETDFDLLCLCNLYFELMNVKEEPYFMVRDVRPTLEEKIAALKDLLRSDGFFEWDLVAEEERNERVATILGMLELAKIRVATLTQRRPFGRIIMKTRDAAALAEG